MINNYQPYVLPAQSVWSETLQSLWGSTALWFIDGSWDHPIALSQASSVALPIPPAYHSATPTADSSLQAVNAVTSTVTPATQRYAAIFNKQIASDGNKHIQPFTGNYRPFLFFDRSTAIICKHRPREQSRKQSRYCEIRCNQSGTRQQDHSCIMDNGIRVIEPCSGYRQQ